MELSIVIPVYNSAATLRALVDRLMAVLEDMSLHCEIVFIDDGSADESWQTVQSLHASHPDRIVAVQLMRNFGQHNALMAGFRHARGEYVITMDDDLQHPPEEIPTLFRAIQEQRLDLVYGAYTEKKHGLGRNFGSGLVNAFYRAVFHNPVQITSFRAIRRQLVESILSYDLNFTYIDGLLAWNTRRIGEVKVRHCPRMQGKSGYSVRKLIELALNLFTNFSLLPLRVVSAVGLAMSASGVLAGGFVLVRYLASDITVPGFASTIIAILVFGGAQLLSLGVIGEYLGRLHLNVNRKPQYSQRTVLPVASAPSASASDDRVIPRDDSAAGEPLSHRKAG